MRMPFLCPAIRAFRYFSDIGQEIVTRAASRDRGFSDFTIFARDFFFFSVGLRPQKTTH